MINAGYLTQQDANIGTRAHIPKHIKTHTHARTSSGQKSKLGEQLHDRKNALILFL